MFNRRALIQASGAMFAVGVSGLSVGQRAAANKAGKLLFIHGRAQQGHDPAQLKRDWISALSRGAGKSNLAVPGRVEVAFPFYGDRLDAFQRGAHIPLTTEAQARGELTDDYLEFQGEVAEEIRQGAHVSEQQIDSQYVPNSQARGPLNWPWVQAILRAIDRYGGGMNSRALEVFTRDVYLYSTRADVHDAINHIVASALTEEPTVIVAHSLGTVVAYSILTSDLRNLQVPLLVTLGCPLGVRAIRDRFRPLHFPDPVTTWFNAYDKRDVVALYPLDSQNFPIRPPVQNDGAVRNGTSSRHGIDGYLDDKAVAATILGGLTT